MAIKLEETPHPLQALLEIWGLKLGIPIVRQGKDGQIHFIDMKHKSKYGRVIEDRELRIMVLKKVQKGDFTTEEIAGEIKVDEKRVQQVIDEMIDDGELKVV